MIGDVRDHLPGWMLRADTDHWKRLLRATFRVVDNLFDKIRVARLASMPGQVVGGESFANVDALALIARDRGTIKGKVEPADVIAARLRDWHAARRAAGTYPGLLYALRAVLSPAPATVRLVRGGMTTEGHWWTLDDTGLRYQATDEEGDHFGVFWPADGGPAEVDSSEALPWDWDSAYWFDGANPDVARVWAIVYAPCGGAELAGEDGQFGDGLSTFGESEAGTGDKYTVGTTATVGYVEAARATCSAFKAAGVVVSHIIVTRNSLAFNPTSASGGSRPDGWWKHHGKIVDDGAGGYERVRARSDQGRYWIGTV